MKSSTMRHSAALLVLLTALASSSALAAPGEDKSLHLPIGDPARRDREAPLGLDGITDTDARAGGLLTPADLPARLAGARLILVGESHTNADFHLAQLRVIQELRRSGREVLIGLEMFPEAEQRWLDAWTDGSLTEEGFLRLSRWYRNWGYNWGYYRDIFLFARDQHLRMFALNAPREVVSAVGRKGLAGLTPEERSRIAARIDTASDEHRTLIRSFFGEDDPLHSNLPKEQLDRMYEAQCTWDATMGQNAVKALKEHGGPGSVLVLLVGSGHVAYGLGIQRQIAGALEGPSRTLLSVIPVPVRDEDGKPRETVRASYADFLWGVPKEADPLYPSLGLSTATGDGIGEGSLKVILVSEKTPAERAGFKAGDILLTMDGAPLVDREALNRAVAGKRWGDAAVITVRRGGETATLTVAFRR
jgi:uncharacterized iron-regulated protein